MTHGMVMILSGLLKHVRGGLDLKRFDHILIRVGGGTGTKKNRLPYPFCEKPSSYRNAKKNEKLQNREEILEAVAR